MIANIMYWTGAICMLLMVASFGIGYLAYRHFEGDR